MRLLVRQPGVTVVALLTLAIGIGGNTAMFSAVDAVLLRPLPYRDPDRLVKVWEKRTAEGVLDNFVAPADFLDWARMTTVFEDMAAYVPITADLTGTGEPVRLSAAGVSPPFFDILRVQPALGRTLRGEEPRAGQRRAIVLGHAVAKHVRQRPRRDRAQDALNGKTHEIVSVMPPGFEAPDSAIEPGTAMPLSGAPTPPTPSDPSLEGLARLAPGVATTAAALTAIGSARCCEGLPRHQSHARRLRAATRARTWRGTCAPDC